MKRVVLKTRHSAQHMSKLCQNVSAVRDCPCGAFNCPMGEGVKCGDVMPWMWKEIMDEEKDDAGCGRAGDAKSSG
jgi:hypothetical protein